MRALSAGGGGARAPRARPNKHPPKPPPPPAPPPPRPPPRPPPPRKPAPPVLAPPVPRLAVLTATATWSPALRPLMICVVLSPARPVTTGCCVRFPLRNRVTVDVPP